MTRRISLAEAIVSSRRIQRDADERRRLLDDGAETPAETAKTCATCRHFRSTANKAENPEANAGVCRKGVLACDCDRYLQVWESFGCTLHELATKDGGQ